MNSRDGAPGARQDSPSDKPRDGAPGNRQESPSDRPRDRAPGDRQDGALPDTEGGASAEVHGEVTRLLLELGPGGLSPESAPDELIDLLYGEMHRIARGLIDRERPGHTLQPTALVNEAYLRLVDQTRATFQSRSHFLSLAARTMRRILVDYARKARASKRGGEWKRVELDDQVPGLGGSPFEIVLLDRALEKLAEEDPRAVQVVEMRVFGGLRIEDIAGALGVSKRTVDQDWATARLWLARELSRTDGE